MKTRRHRIAIIRRLFPARGYRFWVAGIAILLLGVTSFTKAQNAAQMTPVGDNDNYRIGVGDVLKVVVFKQTSLSDEGVRVSNDGTIRMPMLTESIPAACQTEAQLSTEIANRYKKYLLNPQVYVAVKEFNANPVAVGGAVSSPGIFQLKRPMRLLEILSAVNGPAANAGETIQILRTSNGTSCGQKSNNPVINVESPEQQEIISLSLTDLMMGKATANPFLQGGDIVRIPQAQLKQAFIIGNVKSPMTVDLKEPVTLSKAIAMAGGFSQGAKTDKIKIKRRIPDSLATKELIVSLKETNKSQPEDVLLEPNDIVEVPGPKPSLWKDIIRGIVPTVTRVPVPLP